MDLMVASSGGLTGMLRTYLFRLHELNGIYGDDTIESQTQKNERTMNSPTPLLLCSALEA